MTRNEIIGHGSMFAASVMWGLMSPVAKIIVISGTLTPLLLMGFRLLGAMLLFWFASIFVPYEHVDSKDHIRLFFASVIGIVFNQGAFLFGVGLSSPVNASIIATSMPLWAMILSAIYLKEPISGKKVLGIILGAIGALILILNSQRDVSVAQGNVWGDLLVVVAQISYAHYFVSFKNFSLKYSVFTIMKWMFSYAFIIAVPFMFPYLPLIDWSAFDVNLIASVTFVVVCCTFLCYIFITYGQRYLRPTVAGMYNYVQPIVATLVAISWGLDKFNMIKIFSILLIFGGVYMVSKSKSRADIVSNKTK